MEPIVKIEGVSKYFGTTAALADVTNTISGGELVALIGPNGGGKSTLLNIIAGLIVPTEGSVTVDGVPAHELARQAAGRVGLVTARPGVYPLLTGQENLDYFAGLYGVDLTEANDRAAELVARFGLEPAMSQRTRTWSTGMKQRLSLIRALITQPDLLLFDEPTANLDPIGERELHQQLREKADEGIACVLVTHRLHEAQAICDRAWFIDGGIRDEVAIDRTEQSEPSGPLFDFWERSAS